MQLFVCASRVALLLGIVAPKSAVRLHNTAIKVVQGADQADQCKGAGCAPLNLGSYRDTCNNIVVAKIAARPDEKCWRCAWCNGDSPSDAPGTCAQAVNSCEDITNSGGKIGCNTDPAPSGCDADKVKYTKPGAATWALSSDDSPEGLGARVRGYSEYLADLNKPAGCNVMIIQQETYEGEPDESSGFLRKEASNFGSTNTFDIYIFDTATFTNIGDGGFNNWAWVGNVLERTDVDGDDTVTFGHRER